MYALSNEPITPGKGLDDTVELEGVSWIVKNAIFRPYVLVNYFLLKKSYV